MNEETSICLLVGGQLGNKTLRSLYSSGYDIKAVFTDRNSVDCIEFCKSSNIPAFVGNPRKGRAESFISNVKCHVIFSINYLFVVEEDVINLATLFAINLHGSLLPKYRGRTPHVWAIINGEQETGVTAHLMATGVDEGDIIDQQRIPITNNSTGGEILDQFKLIYPLMITRILDSIKKNKVKKIKQDNSKATYFGKRIPSDGRINWNWSRKRIRNWVRAQASPYPGAFTYCNDHKVTINRVKLSDLGFHYKDENGKIIMVNNQEIFIKCSDGVLSISKQDWDSTILFRTKDTFI